MKPSKVASSNISAATTTNKPLTNSLAPSLRKLDGNSSSTASSSSGCKTRIVRGGNSVAALNGRKSPLGVGSRGRRLAAGGAVNNLGNICGNGSIKKHYLSKSNDSLSGGNVAANKKSKRQPPPPAIAVAARGIRHPAVELHQQQLRNCEVAQSEPSEAPVHPDVSTHGSSAAVGEMRRSISANSVELNQLPRDHHLRLPTPENSRPENMPIISLLTSNLSPSQSGMAPVTSSATQTDPLEDFSRSSRRTGSRAQSESEFISLLQEHSDISRQLSELCKVESAPPLDFELPAGRTADWDSQSNTSVCSEPSMACLQDRIQQMEETHHSTHEELQATLQELAEMGDLVTAYKKENEELNGEKRMLQEALCNMTEKVQVHQTQSESLKKLLFRQADNDENSAPENRLMVNEKERALLDLMKGLNEERDELQHQLETALDQNSKLAAGLEDSQTKLHNLDHWCDQVENQKNELERQLNSTREALKRSELETARLAALLDIERSKVNELQSLPKVSEHTDVKDLIDCLKKDKEKIEGHLTVAQERICTLECENQQLTESFKASAERTSVLEKQLTSVAQDLEEQISVKDGEIIQLRQAHDLLERDLMAARKRKAEVEENYEVLQGQFSKEQKDWVFFQDDLLTAVRVANDFRTECELKMKAVEEENVVLRKKNDELITELDRAKVKKPALPVSSPKTILPETPEKRTRLDSLTPVHSPSEGNLMLPRPPRTPTQTGSVRSLIQNMESNIRQGVTRPLNTKVGIRRRDDNFPRTESCSSLDSAEKHSDTSFIDDEPSVPGDGLKPILTNRNRSSIPSSDGKLDKKDDPLDSLVKGKGSKRNGLLKWCQEKTARYPGIDITNFSSSWNDGLAFCSLLHSYLPDKIPFSTLDCKDKRRNFTLAFDAARQVGIKSTLDINDLLSDDRPDWRAVMDYVISIYKHFEVENAMCI